MKKDLPGFIQVIFTNGHSIFSQYIAPVDSPYFDPADFANVANAFANNSNPVFGGGDLNSRVGDLPNEQEPIGGHYRKNCDTYVNEHGKEVMNICHSFSCYVVNNLQLRKKLFDGDFTFRKGGRKAQNDIILANNSALKLVKSFEIHKVGWNPSDHSPISVNCKMTFTKETFGLCASKDILSDRYGETVRKPKRICATNVDWPSYKTLVDGDTPKYGDDINALSNSVTVELLDEVIEKLSNSLYRSANIASTINTEVAESTENAITDTFCELANEMMMKYRENNCTLEEFEKVRQEAICHLQTETTSAERKTWSALLKDKDSKAMWEKINWNGNISSTDNEIVPPLEDLRDQFQMKSETDDMSTLFSEVIMNQHVSVLDDDIEIDEINKAHNTIKEDKTTADGWVKGMLTNVPATLLLVFQIIYNSILKSHTYPSKWRTTFVSAIFKNKGFRHLAQYFRGISIVYLMSKVFDIIMLNRFKKWFIPSDLQTAYQEKKGCPDNVFLLRCLIAYARKVKKKIYIISIDFDGAFDRVSRSVLVRKLSKFGAGTLFVLCIASMYLKTDNIIFQNGETISYALYAGIKQGLPLSPLLFLFYVNDIFDYFEKLYQNVSNSIFDMVHMVMHADDATLLASTRQLAVRKLCSLMEFCKVNAILPQYSKCEFIVINGDDYDKEPLPFGAKLLVHVQYITLLGSHCSSIGSIVEDLRLHMRIRYKSCIKFYNFLRSNKLAPLSVKIKVLKACVVNSVLHNCETFGGNIPEGLEKSYNKLLRCTFGVRSNTPTLTLYIESGFLPIRSLIEARQLKFFERYKKGTIGDTPRVRLFNRLLNEPTKFINHYVELSDKYGSVDDVYKHHNEQVKSNIRDLAAKDKYKYQMYLEVNPELKTSPFINNFHPVCSNIIRFRLGSHRLPIETLRWARIPRENRLCNECGVLGDERHIIYNCIKVNRADLVIPDTWEQMWSSDGLFDLFARLKVAEVFD